ncbi:MAG TPA: zinc-ribbon domain containing protein [Thermoanaerobaculia bacterium]|nr:zinc-ribbon domain containing protein [Thermoanaerobaculia bacterium]
MKKAQAPERTRPHPLFGEIPLVEIACTDAAGREVRYLDYDRDYRPALPAGAVRGDVRRQHFCPMCHVPRYFYIDQEKVCVECHRPFVFSAKEQKYWYEDLQFHFDSVAIRCQECRRKQRTGRALNAGVARAKSRLAENPEDGGRALAVAEALVRLREHTGHGDLSEAIALARGVARSSATPANLRGEAMFWEGKAQTLLSRQDRAIPLFQSALEVLPFSKRGASLRAEADWYLSLQKPEPEN